MGTKNKANKNNRSLPQRTWTSPRPGKNASIVPVPLRSCRQIACRLLVPQPLDPATKDKISMFCHVVSEQVFGVHDVTSVYHVPLLLQSQGIAEFLRKRLKLETSRRRWRIKGNRWGNDGKT